jgi:hypothetical protein
MNNRKFLPLTVAIAGLVLAPPIASATANPATSQLPPAQHAGAVTYLNGGAQAPQAEAIYAAAANYPLQLDFLWGRGAKESEISKVDWAISNAAGHTLVKAESTGPIVLASLPDGHYTVKATHDGKQLTRNVTVQKGKQDTVLLEWPQ